MVAGTNALVSVVPTTDTHWLVMPPIVMPDAPDDKPLILLWPFVNAALGHAPNVPDTLVTFTLILQVTPAFTAAPAVVTMLEPAAAVTNAAAA